MSEAVQTLYNNTSHSNEATLGGSVVDNMKLPAITWRTLIVDILHENLEYPKENLEDYYDISEKGSEFP